MSKEGQGRGTRARLRRGNGETGGKVPLAEVSLPCESRTGEKAMPERDRVIGCEEIEGEAALAAGGRAGIEARRSGSTGSGEGGRGRPQDGGRSRRGRGARVLNLPKQGAFHILRLRQKAEISVLTVPKGRSDVISRHTERPRLAAGSKPARGDPVPPVQRETVGLGTDTRGRRGRNNRGRSGRGRGSGRRRASDPQHRGRARRPWPRGSHGDHRAIGWGRRNPGRRRSLPKGHIKSITCRLLRRGVPIPRHEARAQGTGWVRL